MVKKYRLGIAGLIHDHVWSELEIWAQTGRVDIVAVADPNPSLVERVKKDFGVQHVFATAEQMFDACPLDIVQVSTSNAWALDVVLQAAKHEIHVVLEKPMAATLQQAQQMVSAVQSSGIQFLINWPNRWRPGTLQSWKLIQNGAVGDIFTAHMRMAHKGPREFGCSEYFCQWLYDASQNGAGALVDYCCYGAVAFRYLFGMPNVIQAVAGRLVKQDISTDDNASITLIYDTRFAFTEASWSQIPSYHDAVYLGTSGTLSTHAGTIRLADENGQRAIPIEPLPRDRRNGPEYFLTCLDSGEPPGDVCSMQICRDAQEILEAAKYASTSGGRIQLPLSEEVT